MTSLTTYFSGNSAIDWPLASFWATAHFQFRRKNLMRRALTLLKSGGSKPKKDWQILPMDDWMRMDPIAFASRPADDIAALQKLRSLLEIEPRYARVVSDKMNTYFRYTQTPQSLWRTVLVIRDTLKRENMPHADLIAELLSKCHKQPNLIPVACNTILDPINGPRSPEDEHVDIECLPANVPTPAEAPIVIKGSREALLESVKTEPVNIKLWERLIPDSSANLKLHAATSALSNKTVFFSNVPPHATYEEIAKALAPIGPIVDAEVFADDRPPRADRHPSGWTALVTFASEEDSEKATSTAGRLFGMLCNSDVHGSRSIYPEKIERKRTLLVRGVPWHMSVPDVLKEIATEIATSEGVTSCELVLRNSALFNIDGYSISATSRQTKKPAYKDKNSKDILNDGIFCLRFSTPDEAMHVLRNFNKTPLVIGCSICTVVPADRRSRLVDGKYVDFLLPPKSSVYDNRDFTPLTM